MDEFFIREFDIDLPSKTKTLQLHQKIEGDVSCVVWDAAIILSKYLEVLHKTQPTYFKNLKVIELGAGVGCVGLTAACLGANVLLTDLPETTELLDLNVKCNRNIWYPSGSVEVSCLEWGLNTRTPFSPDLILLADCVYYKTSVLPLIKTLKELSINGTNIILSQELRDTEKQIECWNFFMKSVQRDFYLEMVPLEEQHPDYSCKEVVIIRIKKKV